MQGCTPAVTDQCRLAVHTDEPLAQHRLIQNTEHGEAVFLEGDERAPFMPPGYECPRSIDWIKNPSEAVYGVLFGEFLAKDSVIRPILLDNQPHGLLSALIGGSYRVEHHALGKAFVGNLDLLPEIGTDHLTRRVSEFMGEVNCSRVNRHSSMMLTQTT